MIKKILIAAAALALTAGGVAAYGNIEGNLDTHPPTSPLETPPPPDPSGEPPTGGEHPPGERDHDQNPPQLDLAAIAEALGVTEEDLHNALGDPQDDPPDLEAVAEQLGVTLDELMQVLPPPPRDQQETQCPPCDGQSSGAGGRPPGGEGQPPNGEGQPPGGGEGQPPNGEGQPPNGEGQPPAQPPEG